MTSYVLGFLFNMKGEVVWLIRKSKPNWQKGLLNGIGGKIEQNETPLQAMEREFKEEAGLEIKDWKEFCILTDEAKGFEVYCFYAFSELTPWTVTEEEVVWHKTSSIPKDALSNLNWLIPMALHSKGFHTKVIYD